MQNVSLQKNIQVCKNIKSGFSLIEVLVSLSIFTIVVTISVGALMVLIAANSKEQKTQSVMTNVTYALDSMTREIRTGSDFYCSSVESSLPTSGQTTSDCVNGTGFSFNEGGKSLTENLPSRRIAFRLNNGVVERRLSTGSWAALTSPDVVINQLTFYTTGSNRYTVGSDIISPTVTIYIKGTAGTGDDTESTFNVQTTVVQQLLDI